MSIGSGCFGTGAIFILLAGELASPSQIPGGDCGHEESEELDCVLLIREADSVMGKRGEEMSRRVKDVLLFEYDPGEEE